MPIAIANPKSENILIIASTLKDVGEEDVASNSKYDIASSMLS